MAASGSNNKRPELRLTGNVAENFKNFELRFDDYCIQADYRDLTKNRETEKDDYYKKKEMEISALRSSMPDEALQVIRYTIDPQIVAADKNKPWIWMDKLREHYTGTSGSSLMTDRFKYWQLGQNNSDSVQDWEVKVRQAGSLCQYAAMSDEMNRDKFVFGLQDPTIRTELLKTHLKSDNTTNKSLGDVVSEAKALESAQKANQLISESSKSHEEQVHFTRLSHKDMKLRREKGTCFWCGRNGQHAWKDCEANGKICSKCGINDHLARVCLETPRFDSGIPRGGSSARGRGRAFRGGRNNNSFNSRGRGGNHSGGRSNHRGRGGFNSIGGRSNFNNYSQQRDVHHTEMEGEDVYYYDDHQDTNNSEYDVNHITHALDISGEYGTEHYEHGNNEIHYTFALENCAEHDINQVHSKKPGKKYYANLQTSSNGDKFHHIPFQIDTAATCNTIGDDVVKKRFPDVELTKSYAILSPYGNGKPIKPIGAVQLICERKKKYHTLEFQVLHQIHMQNKPALLSGEDSEKLGLVTIHADEVHAVECDPKPVDIVSDDSNGGDEQGDVISDEECTPPTGTVRSRVNHTDSHTLFPLRRPLQKNRPTRIRRKFELPSNRPLSKDDIINHYKNNFEGIGKLGPPVKFKTKPDVTPIQMPIHRVPISKRLKEKLALRKLEAAGFITREREPTDWCSNILCRESPKKFRVCIDPSQTINKAIERPVFQMPTLKEQLHELKKAKVFSVIDVKDGFFHIPLDHQSSLMTTMHTSYGRYRWLVLPNGISSAPEEFQMRLLQVLEGLSSIIVIADDILVFGSGDTQEEAEADHDKNLVALMERAEEVNLKFNLEKFQFKKKEVKYVGHILTADGIKADPEKVKAVTEMEAPSDVAGVRRFIGMINFLSPYCENLSSKMRPLTELTKKGMSFMWGEHGILPPHDSGGT